MGCFCREKLQFSFYIFMVAYNINSFYFCFYGEIKLKSKRNIKNNIINVFDEDGNPLDITKIVYSFSADFFNKLKQ